MHIFDFFRDIFSVFGAFSRFFLGVKFGFRKSCQCKRNDKYEVWCHYYLGWSLKCLKYDPVENLTILNGEIYRWKSQDFKVCESKMSAKSGQKISNDPTQNTRHIWAPPHLPVPPHPLPYLSIDSHFCLSSVKSTDISNEMILIKRCWCFPNGLLVS